MKPLALVGSVLALLPIAVFSPATAQMMPETPELEASEEGYTPSSDIRQTEAFNLVRLAYRGEFEEEGVSSYRNLIQDYQTGDVTAEGLVQAAIEDGYLRPGALDDEEYINAVELQLDVLSTRPGS